SPLRSALILIVSLLGILFMLPNLLPKQVVEALPDFLPKQTMTLGLDLQGGSHLLLQVNRDSIVSQRVTDLRRDARSVLATENGIGNIITTRPTSIVVESTGSTQRGAAMQALRGLQNTISHVLFGGLVVEELTFSKSPDGRIVVALTEEGI